VTSKQIGIGLMCKPPRPGTSKTRLAATIGNDAAALLSRAFLEDSANAIQSAARIASLDPIAFYRPADAAQELGEILGPGWPLALADAGDLGATMVEALATCLAQCPAGAMIMGADVPLMDSEAIAAAAETLRRAGPSGVVIVPSLDGGYSLIGVGSVEAARVLCAPMAWSTPTVLEETLRRAKAAQLSVQLMPPQRDIDELADLEWLQSQLAINFKAAPKTRRVIAGLTKTL
jgi:uncharacterized protein